MFMKYFSIRLMCIVYSPSAVCFLTLIYLNIALLYYQVMLLISGEYSDMVILY